MTEQEEFEFRQRLEQEQEQAQAPTAAPASESGMLSKAADSVGPGFVAESLGAGAGALLGPGIKSEVDKYGIPGLKPIPKPPIQVPPSFKSPSQVAEQAIKNRIASVTVEGVPEGAVKNYGLSSQFVNPAGEKVYYGADQTGDYAGVHSAAKEAIASEKQFPGMKPIQGGTTPFSVPEHVAKELEVLRLQEEAARAANNQAEVNKIAQTRAARLKAVEDAYAQINKAPGFLESMRTAPLQAARRGVENFGDFLNRSISPHGLATAGSRALGALGGYDVGMQGTEAVKHLSNDQWGRAAVSGLGALGGAAALTRHPLLMPLGIGAAVAAPVINNYLEGVAAKHPDWHLAEGGAVHMADGGQPNVQQIQRNISPQEQAIIDYHRNTIASGNVGRDEQGYPVTVYSNSIDIPSGPHAGKVATVPGYFDSKIHNDPKEIYNKWGSQIDQGKWPIYYDPRTADTRAKYIHGVMDQEGDRLPKLAEGGLALEELYPGAKITRAGPQPPPTESGKGSEEHIRNLEALRFKRGNANAKPELFTEPKAKPSGRVGGGGAGFVPGGTTNPFNPDSPLNRKKGGKVKKK